MSLNAVLERKERINRTANVVMTEPVLPVSLFSSKKDTGPTAAKVPWSQLGRTIFSAHVVSENKDGPAFSPVSYKVGAKRGIAGVEFVYAAAFDVENHGAFDLIRSKLVGYAFVAHSTYSHKKDDPRYRVIVLLAEPVPVELWPETWQRLNHWLGGINDASTKDAARIYYLPRRPPNSKDHFLEIGEGKPLSLSEIPELEAQTERDVRSKSRTGRIKIDGIESPPRAHLSPEVGLPRVVSKCIFMRQMSEPENQPQVTRPLWRAILSNAGCFEKSEEWAHRASQHHPKYSQAETQREFEGLRAFEGGPITCQRIQDDGFKSCPQGGCQTVTGNVTKAPAGLWVGESPITAGPYADLPLPEHVSSLLLKKFPDGLIYANESFLGYADGYWKMLEERGDVRHAIACHLGTEATEAKQINDMLSLTKDFLARSDANATPNLRYLCLENGTLDLQTCQLVAHDRAFSLRCKIPASWRPEATCQRWLQFLDEIFAGDQDAAEKVQFLQEWFGYCLTADSSQHKFVWMVGGGGNGKSVLLGVLSQLLGPSNVSHAHLERLERAPVRAELEGKLVNISSEMSAESTMADGYLKAIVAGDEIDAERKYKPPFSFKPFVRIVGATNHLPRLLDLSEGFFRRAVVLKFNRRFTEQQQDKELPAKLTAELSGILGWAVTGLQRLRERGSFIIPRSSTAALEVYRAESDPVKMFADECLESSSISAIAAKHIYAAYKEWSLAYGYRPGNDATFGKRMTDLGFLGQRRSEGRFWNVKEKPDNGFLNQFGTIDSVPIAQESKPATTAGAVTAVTGNDGTK